MRILIVGSHPDDEVLGVGGTLCKHVSNGDEVYVCIITKAYEPHWTREYVENKFREQNEVDKVFKIKKRFHLNFPTIKLNIIPHGELNKAVTNIVEKINPHIIYTHYENDINYDHTLVFRACMVATRPPKRIKLISYETLSETEWNNKPFSPNLWIDIEDHIEKKIEAFEIYKSEVESSFHPRSEEGIRNLAKKRGFEIMVKYAEAFMVIRDYWC